MKKRLIVSLFLLIIAFSLIGCGARESEPPIEQPVPADPVSESEPPASESEQSEIPAEEPSEFNVGAVIEFGGYLWRVLDVKDGKALLLTDEIIALDYIHITQEARDALDSIAAIHPTKYNHLSDYEGWNLLVDDDVFSEGDKFYDHWDELYDDDPLYDPYKLRESTSWADCSLRYRLNSEMPFSDEEWAQILETEVVDPVTGSTVSDKVFLLSTKQVEWYFPRVNGRGAKATGVSDEVLLTVMKDKHIMGWITGQQCEWVLDLIDGGNYIWWVLGENEYDLLGCYVGVEEQLSGFAPAEVIAGVRPAIWISTEVQ